MGNREIIELADTHLIPTYSRFPVALVRGQGMRVWDADGRQYLDFLAGIAVCNLGHCHPRVVEAIQAQAETLLHVSNLYYIEPQARLAELLTKTTFADRVFFCNSGAEANEAAIKLARKYQKDRGEQQRSQIVSATMSFHGRTLATLTATGQDKVKTGFAPLPEGFTYVPYDDPDALAQAVTPETVAVLLEPLQGEGGVRLPSEGYLRRAREICDANGALLIGRFSPASKRV
jgi:acetylornithine aminotransferase/acetylornithine/N-succinyldiaminopimelate aminotransferase